MIFSESETTSGTQRRAGLVDGVGGAVKQDGGTRVGGSIGHFIGIFCLLVAFRKLPREEAATTESEM